ncbi:amidase [Flavisolibacter nicotianae]|uniref:amidase n=1 Tax=Flavisolibacter nicotianae TaxID=2364882 RepID=UPI000EAB6068|nr:amidase [Flavisolibacter nicotianae]
MKKIILFLALGAGLISNAQTRKDSLRLLQQTAGLYDLDFTEAETDSLLANVLAAKSILQRMHQELLSNDLPFPFAFHPAPPGFSIPAKQQKIAWDIPANVALPKNKSDLAFYSIPQLASLLKNKKISSVELTRFYLDRLKKWGDTLECVVTLTEDLALQQARTADEELRKGLYRGLLHGIPYGLKDLFAVKGYKTTWGAMPYKDQMVEEDAFVYTQLKNAGAVLCAKLTLGELAMGDRWFGGLTRNPWNLKQGSSGSSAGSASSVVAGLLPFAIGTETLGSIVSPSTRCGATGLRPTFGTISRSGAMVLCWSLDKAGPISRSAEDDAIVYSYLKGTDGKDAGAVDHAFNYNPKRDIKKLRIAYAENYFSRLPKDAPEWNVLETFKKMGNTPQAVSFPDSTVYPANLVGIILNAEAGAAFDELTRSGRDSILVQQSRFSWPNTFRSARFIPAVEYINANRYRSRLCQQVQQFLKDYDVVIVPTFAGAQLRITNLTGNPVVCLPMGYDKNGLPQSITFVGNLYDEASILEAAKAYQSKTEHNKKHPSLFTNQSY